MLVGQDWGCPFDKSFSGTMAEIQKANNGEAYNYLSPARDFGPKRHAIEKNGTAKKE